MWWSWRTEPQRLCRGLSRCQETLFTLMQIFQSLLCVYDVGGLKFVRAVERVSLTRAASESCTWRSVWWSRVRLRGINGSKTICLVLALGDDFSWCHKATWVRHGVGALENHVGIRAWVPAYLREYGAGMDERLLGPRKLQRIYPHSSRQGL